MVELGKIQLIQTQLYYPRMIFETASLPPAIDRCLESLFHLKGFKPDHSIERVVPTGHVFIIFEFDGMPRHTFDNETLKPDREFTRVWISGMHRRYLSISALPDSEMLVMQFKPAGSHPFLHIDVSRLNEQVVPAEEVLGEGILDLRERLLTADSSQDKFEIALRWLEARFDAGKTPPDELMKIVEALQNEPVGRFDEAVRGYPNSAKHLIDQFKKYVGLTPKVFQRILRFSELLQQLQREEKIDWADIAYRCGYADQSHFIREFRHFSGFNPTEFIRQEFNKGESNFFPLDRGGK